ncbi:MAG TPA: hypothetical protein VKR22_10625 [Acidimicrobiales bacterium]|nr:hypothetical protein [Acidimicrobiales bacterium]
MRRYQDEPSAIAESDWKRGHLTPLELLRIGAWKEARIPAAMSVNLEGRIEEVTAGALRALDEAGVREWEPLEDTDDLFWEKYARVVRQVVGSSDDRSGLYGLDGVRYPAASAVLHILVPNAFPVIDQHAVRAVFGSVLEGYVLPKKRAWWYRHVVYVPFTRHLATVVHARSPGVSLHGLDLRAQTAGRLVLRGGKEAQAVRMDWVPIDLPPQVLDQGGVERRATTSGNGILST